MEKSNIIVFVFLLLLFPLFANGAGTKDGLETWGYVEVRPRTKDGLETWGYVEVRPKAYMFWWYYKSPYRTRNSSKPWPVILWLQGGPGASGVGIGNFQEIGPLDEYLKPRQSTWLKKADLLFVDNPVGTGYSYVEDTKLLVKTDEEAATDLTTLLISVFNHNTKLRKNPLYIVAESYGGKFAVTLGLSALKAIEKGRLNAKLGGIVMGNSWISAEDYVLSWGPLLNDVSRLDNNGLRASNMLADQIKNRLKDGKFFDATDSWVELEGVIDSYSNGVDFYNFLLDHARPATESSQQISVKRYSTYLTSLKSSSKQSGGQDGNLTRLMNEEIKKKLMVIPKNVTWVESSDPVFEALAGDFMKPRINEVDQLLSKGVNVTIYNGQLDLICCTKGTESWVEKLKWDGIKTFLSKNTTAIYWVGNGITNAFVKSHKNFKFYWILGAGHFVPADQPRVAINMIAAITKSPNS